MCEMLESLESYVKLAVEFERRILAGGGILHADCEAALLEDGSRQADIWGADWLPSSQEVTFESLINIRPRQNNFGLEIEDEVLLRERIEKIVRNLLEKVNYE
ncbi:hypothetical protein BH18ACI1_BH18ACI1_10320 [soil metagenome]